MTTFAPSELIPSTEFVRNFWKYSKWIENMEFNKLWILKNNKLDMVILPWKVFEQFWEIFSNLFEEKEKNRLKWMSWDEIESNFIEKNWDSKWLSWDESVIFLKKLSDSVWK